MCADIIFDKNGVVVENWSSDYLYLSEIIQHLQNVSSDEVDWSLAPENAVAYAEDFDGDGAWYNTTEIGANTRFGDWQHERTHSTDCYISKAPKFGTTKHAYTDSIRYRNTDRKLNIKIIVEDKHD